MEIITGVYQDRLSFEQDENGKYDVLLNYDDERKYRTGFVYDSIKLLNEYLLRVGQIDSEGSMKYGVISVWFDPLILPCWFDIIKPYKGDVLRGVIGEEEYRINRWGCVSNLELWKISNS